MSPVQVIMIASLLVCLTVFWSALRSGLPLLWFVAVVGLGYPVAKFCQHWEIGPGFFQWWIADMGFVPFAMTFATAIVFEGPSSQRHSIDRKLVTILWAGFGAMLLATAVELFQLFAIDPAIEQGRIEDTRVRGDVLDIVAYIVGFAIAGAAVWLERAALRELQREESAKQEAVATQPHLPQRKRRKRKKHGRRR